MSSSVGLDRISLKNYNSCFCDLEREVRSLFRSTKSGDLDFSKIDFFKKIIGCIKAIIEKGNLSYIKYDWNFAVSDEIKETKVFYNLTGSEIKRFNSLKQTFSDISKIADQVKKIFNPNACVWKDNQDQIVEKVGTRFYFKPENLTVIIEKRVCADYSQTLLIPDLFGTTWQCNGIPLGPRKLTAQAKKIDFYIKSSNGDLRSMDTLSSEYIRTVLNFVKKGRPNSKVFCCLGFAQLFGMNFKGFLGDEPVLATGDIVCLTNKKRTEKDRDITRFIEKNFSHFAVYLNDSFYLSLYGTTGPLHVATLEAMQKYYNSQDVLFFKH